MELNDKLFRDCELVLETIPCTISEWRGLTFGGGARFLCALGKTRNVKFSVFIRNTRRGNSAQ